MDDVIKFGLVISMVLAVGTFLMFMVPIAMRNFRRANLVGRESADELDALRAEKSALDANPSLTPDERAVILLRRIDGRFPAEERTHARSLLGLL